MFNLYKANMKRITGNTFFIAGCLIAFLVTLAFTANLTGMTGRFEKIGPDRRMFFISIAMMVFFTIFVPLYTNLEYRYGVIRNKIIAGYSQKQVYVSYLVGYFTALGIMMIAYMLGGIFGGAGDYGNMIVLNIILYLALCGYIATMMLISFHIQKIVALSVAAFLIMNICYSGCMFGNALLSFVLKGTAKKIGVVIYNISVFGQWLARSGFADDFVDPGKIMQMVISVIVIVVMMFFATIGLDKRDIK